ncbi:MAG: hypothetical protein I3270_01035 [Candidatus Moeniiplasma glomeromycotorum]|nr:hypothetical protein [Candidatus Moeniiplasma glomeromycotorum]MCE8162296.1 hypothetical protein [Candidatus Moeniiplasma glomeromycotorum]MCE8166220.1 hypothetical protein [Candidatus Moeniiplasma glomeromycotorum]MCE8166702.1 hypothetical protein [Candidatus Moeniiplasma glomeromycotorum]
MNYNKDLYQIIKIDKNASQQQIIKVSQDLIPKKSSGPVEISREVDQAIMVLTDPQKRIEYDKSGWKEEWGREWEKDRNFRHSIFEEIQNYKHHYGNTYALKPDGFRVYVYPEKHFEDLSLLEPYECWVSKIWSFRGSNWKQELKTWKGKMLSALDKAWEKEEKTPLLDNCWEAVESGDCAKCGKTARLRWKGKTKDINSGKIYCSPECYDDDWRAGIMKVPIIKYESKNFEYKVPEFICVECHYKGRDAYEMGDVKHKCKKCFNKYLEELKKSFQNKRKFNKNELDKYKCSNCGKKYDGVGYDVKDSDGNHYCSENCQETHTNKPKPNNVSSIIRKLERFLAQKNPHQPEITQTEYNRLTGKTKTKKVKWNPLRELLNWMKREGITNISLNSQGNLVIEYGSRSTTLKDNELTKEQKEIKEFFQTVGQNHLSRNELEQAVNKQDQQEGKKPKNDWVIPVTISVVAVLIIILIGTVAYYRNKAKKGY